MSNNKVRELFTLAWLSGLVYLAFIAAIVWCPLTINAASNYTTATHYGTLVITNNGTATASGVSVNFTLNTQTLINNHYVNANVTDSTIIMPGGSDTAYQPGDNVSNTWMVYVPSIAGNTEVNDTLYTGGVTNMGGKIRIFGSMTTPDHTSIEISSNGTYQISGLVDMAVSANVASKDGAFMIATNATSGNITAWMSGEWSYPSASWLSGNVTGFSSANLTDGNTATPGAHISATGNWVLIDAGAGNSIALAGWRHYVINSADDSFLYIQYSTDNITWNTIYSNLILTNNAWTEAHWNPFGYYRYWRGLAQVIGSADMTEIQISRAFHATVGGQTTGEKTVRMGIPWWQTGNVLSLDGTANAYINGGNLYSSQAKCWVAQWVYFPSASAPAATQYMFNKGDAANNYWYLRRTATGAIQVGKNLLGAGATFLATTTTNYAVGWHFILMSVSDVNGMRMRVDGETVTNAAILTATPNAGNFVIGNYDIAGTNPGYPGYYANITVGTDDLSAAEEANLAKATAPADATDYWFADEGAGNSVTSYGSAGNTATKGAAATWTTSTYTSGWTGRPYEFGIQANTTAGFQRYIYGASIADNGNSIVTATNYVMPYIEYQSVSVNGTQTQYVDWEYGATFTDTSGYGNNATPTFRTTSSNAYVSANLTSFLPIAQAIAVSAGTEPTPSPVPSAPGQPAQVYTELDTSHLPGAGVWNAILTAGSIPLSIFWFPIAYGTAIMAGLGVLALIYKKNSAIDDEALVMQGVVSGLVMVAWSITGVLPWWPFIPFAVEVLAMVLKKQFAGGW